MCRSHTPSRARASQSGALCRLASSLPPFRFPPTAVAQALNVSRVLCPGRIHLPQASLQASPRPDSFRRGTLLCALPHDSHGRAHRSSPQKSTCITHAPVVSGSCAFLNLRGFRLRYPVQLFTTYPFEAPARLPVLVSPHLPPLHLTTENLTSPLLLREGGPVCSTESYSDMAGGCSNRASIVVSIAWQHRDVLPTGMMLAPACSDRLLPGRAMHCICRAIHWDSPGICCLGYSDRVVNGILALRESLTPRVVLAVSGDARCRACVIAVRGRDCSTSYIVYRWL